MASIWLDLIIETDILVDNLLLFPFLSVSHIILWFVVLVN